jgi:subtilisin family serine protease
MRRTPGFVTLAVTALLAFGVITAGAAPNPFAGETSTAGGYYTWDADQIDAEGLAQTGSNVYVAVVDTGLVPNWRDYFPEARVATELGTGFDQPVSFKAKKDECGLGVEIGNLSQSTWVGSTGSTHGTHVASTILGYFYRSNTDAVSGFPLPPIMVRGIAPNVTIIPVRVLADYQVPALPKCGTGIPAQKAVFGTDAMVAAGINYVTELKTSGALGNSPVVINMSLGGDALAQIEQDAIDDAIAAGVIVVAAAGNAGEAGMDFPGAYPPVISAGASGWTKEWLNPSGPNAGLPRYRMWWLKNTCGGTCPFNLVPPLLAGTGDVADPTSANDVYVTDFSSRAYTGAGQQLDVLAPGSWVRGPFPGVPGFSHLPWHSKGIGDLIGGNPGNFFYVGGTSMATPHVASAAALILSKNPTRTQAQIESTLKATALAIPASGSQNIFDFDHFATMSWDTDCNGTPCDAVGAGLIQVDDALAATP